ncbi:DUF1983 domain-containing protein [Pseudomonas sp. MUP55]|uniref:TipJ family phage tail tip protein n=1 Tax=Pseudomonas sp. MUP55 TaxID=3087234 RepID=UPI002A5A59F2|nr:MULTISPECIES: phage tail protein [unclassified Pseudomonas]WPN90301.1 phage tail protein [Pseudomonas sp. MUP56]WPN95825.1 phage tail protein [Pseudomonas sp. MUP55]
MGAALKIDIHGAKGGEDKPKTPTEAPDSLRSVAIAKMLIGVGEGEFEGTPTARDIYLDNTPLQDPQGNMNFPNVRWEWGTGAVDQTYIQGIPSVENETTISTELRSGTPWVRAISNNQLSAIRVRFAWPALQSVDTAGNINGYRIEYKVELATDGGAYQQVLSEAVDGKTTSVYERTRRIDLPKAAAGWLLRITRITPNQNNNKISDTMQIAGFTEVIDAKIRYPNTALLYIEFSAEQFRSIPAVTVETKLKKVQVPSNYDPVARSYSGVWDGTFKQAWTDNAVWMTYDITTADRFGLGRRIKPWMVDKWELYRISHYCDQLVPDGKGGQEPRFICNLNLQSKADAWSLLRDISAIYRGMTYWAQGQVFTLSDMPRATDFDFAYTRANVIDGKFTYSSASERTRYTRALVSYDNPLNNYDTDVTAVTDQKLQRRYGDNPLEISAIGCTRESEAQRRGKWALLTNSKDRAVTFKVGLDGRIPLPGYVIPIADELLAGRPVGGRISAVNGKVIKLDRDTQAKPGDRLILNLPDGKCEGRTVQLVSGRQVTVTVAYSVTPEPELVWALDADDLAIPLYRVVSVARPEPGVFEISAVQYDPSKFAHIDIGTILETTDALVSQVQIIETKIEEIDGKVLATATSVEALRSAARGDDGAGDLADAIKGWTSTADLAVERKTRASENDAMAQQLLTLSAQVGDNRSSLTVLEQVVASNREASAAQITQLKSDLSAVDQRATGNAQAITSLDTKVTNLDGRITSQASSNEALRASVRGDNGSGDLAGAIKAWESTAAISTEKKVRASEIEAQAKVSETLQSSIGQTSASVQSVSETVVQLNGKVLAQTTMKAQTIVDGRRVVSGLAFGANGDQSEFLIFAQRFAVVNEISGKVDPMFVIENGQAIFNTAIISKAFIEQIILGMSLRSAAVDAYGNPLIELNMATGSFALRGVKDGNTSVLNSSGIKFTYANGIDGIDLSL